MGRPSGVALSVERFGPSSRITLRRRFSLEIAPEYCVLTEGQHPPGCGPAPGGAAKGHRIGGPNIVSEVHQGKPLSYWLTTLGSGDETSPPETVQALRALGQS